MAPQTRGRKASPKPAPAKPAARPGARLRTPSPRARTAPGNRRLAGRIVVPVQGSDGETPAHEEAALLAAALGVPVVGLHVAAAAGPEASAAFVPLANACRRLALPFQAKVVTGNDPAWAIAQETGPHDLVVMGTRRAGSHFHIGSIAERLLRCALARVLLIRLADR